MLNALRLREGFSAALFTARTGLPVTALDPQLTALVDEGLLEYCGDHIRCTALGWRFLDDVVGRFFDA